MTSIKEQLEDFMKRPGLDTALQNECKMVVKTIETIDGTLVQRKQQTFQDVINFPNQLDAELKHIEGTIEDGYLPVTNGQKIRVHDVLEKWNQAQVKINAMYQQVSELNERIMNGSVPLIHVERKARS